MFTILIIIGLFVFVLGFCFITENEKKIGALMMIVASLMYVGMYFTYTPVLCGSYKVSEVIECTIPVTRDKNNIGYVVKTDNGVFVLDGHDTEHCLNNANTLEIYVFKSLFMTTGEYKYVLKR